MKQPEPIIVKDWQKGIADSPNLGFEDIRNLNILSSPGAVSLNFALSALNKPPTVSALAYTTNTGTDVVTVSSTSGWFNSMAITLDTVVTSTGISTGRVYWIGDLTATTFKLYKNPSLETASLVDITGSNGSGTLSSYTLSAPLDKAIDYDPNLTGVPAFVLILDDAGRVWWIKNLENDVAGLTTNLVYLGNDTLTSTGNRAIAVWKNYILVFRSGHVDYLATSLLHASTDLDGVSGWTYGWDTRSSVVNVSRRAVFVGQDDVLYFQNGSNKIGSYVETADVTFDPTNSATWTENLTALDLPDGDDVLSLGELGTSLLIGTKLNNIYLWDRTSTSFDLPLKVPEFGIHRIVTVNNIAYIFAGNTGRIYYTNGSSLALFKKIPDHVSGLPTPYYTWGDAIWWRNQLYFSFTANENDGDSSTAVNGVWAIDTTTGALRYTHTPTSSTAAVPVLIPHVLTSMPPGNALYIGWSTGSVYGVDISATTYATSYSGYTISPLFSIGDPLNRKTISNAHLVFESALASGEGVKIYFRRDRSQSWSTAVTFDFATYGAVADGHITFPASDLTTIQFKVELTGSSTTPDLREIRFT